MPTLTQIKQDIDQGLSLKLVSQAYSEISASKLSKIKTSIQKNTEFASEISYVYQLVKYEALKRAVPGQAKLPKTASIILTSNYQFYGSLERSLIRYFMDHTDNSFKDDQDNIERVMVGSTGSNYLKNIGYKYPFKTVTFKSDLPTKQEIKQLLSYFVNYQKIFVYHSGFKSVLSQVSVITDISQSVNNISLTPEKVKSHIYEPELGQTLDFFNTQIVEILVEQTFLESELARTAARLISMDQAQINADNYIGKKKQELFAAKHSIDNNRLLEIANVLANLKKDLYG